MRIKTRTRMVASVVITALLISSILLIPTQASAFNVALTMPASSYLLGETPSFTGSLNLEGNTEVVNIQQVQLVMDGPSLDFTVNLPINAGSFSYSLPKSGSDANRGTVTGSISWNNINFASGYGYGYANPAGTAKINYTINWQPPLLLDPAPAQIASLPSWQTAFNTNSNVTVKGVGYRGGDYNDLYVLVAGSPNDKIHIYDLSTGNPPTVVDLGLGSSLEALDFFPNKGIYVADSSNIYRLSITSPSTVLNTWSTTLQIGGLTNDGTNLWAAAKYSNQLRKINPNTGADIGAPFYLNSPTGPPYFGMSLPGSSGLGFYADNNNLLWANGGQIFRIDMSGASPAVQGMENLNPYISVDGLAVTGIGHIFMGANDMGQNKIIKAKHPNAPATETSASGSYNAKLKVTTNPSTYESSAASFSLNKVSQVTLTVAQPSSTTFATSTPTVSIAGSTNDPSITQVSVATALGTTEFISDKVESTTAPAGKTTGQVWQASGMWHQSQNRSLDISSPAVSTVNQTGKKSWAYNQPNSMPYAMPPVSYDNFATNSGSLQSNDTFSVKGDSSLSFWTAWNTEPTEMFDRKFVQVFVDGQWRTVAQIVEFVPGIGGGGGAPPPMGPPTGGFAPFGVSNTLATVVSPPGNMGAPPNSPAGWPWKFVMVPQFTWQQVQLDFTGSNSYNNKDIKVRFFFDTYDQYANMMEGWYVDNIIFKGAAASGVSVPVTNMNFSTSVALGEGSNTILVTADSGYKAAFSPTDKGTATTTLTGSLDNTAPVITLGNMTPSGGTAVSLATNPVTGSASATVTWTVTETNPGTMTATQSSAAGDKPVKSATGSGAAGSFSESVILVAGTNTLTFNATDNAGNAATAKTATIIYDVIGPTVTVYSVTTPTGPPTVYPTGQVSARAGDFLVFQADAEDTGSGVKQVDLLLSTQANLTDSWTTAQKTALAAGDEVTITSSAAERYQKIDGVVYKLKDFKKASNIPTAVLTQWGVSGTLTSRWVAPFNLSSTAPGGTYSLTIRAKDQGDNAATATVTASVVSTLSSFNILLMPNWNLISTPLIPTSTSIATVFSGMQAQGLLSVWYYNSITASWQSYDPSAPSGVNSLTTFEAGKGYWVNMNPTGWPTDLPLAEGFAATPRPVKLTVTGVVLNPKEVPPTYTIKAGWNLIGLHSENNKPVSTALGGLISPYGASLWASLLEYKNYIRYPTQAGESPETVLGKFDFLDSSSTMNPGKGYWLYAIQDSTITP